MMKKKYVRELKEELKLSSVLLGKNSLMISKLVTKLKEETVREEVWFNYEKRITANHIKMMRIEDLLKKGVKIE